MLANLQRQYANIQQNGWRPEAVQAAEATRVKVRQIHDATLRDQQATREERVQAIVDEKTKLVQSGSLQRKFHEEAPSKPLTVAEAREQMSEEQLLKIADYAKRRGGQI